MRRRLRTIWRWTYWLFLRNVWSLLSLRVTPLYLWPGMFCLLVGGPVMTYLGAALVATGIVEPVRRAVLRGDSEGLYGSERAITALRQDEPPVPHDPQDESTSR